MDKALTRAAERRRHYRVSLKMGVQCVRLDPHEGDVIDRIHLVDMSRSGIGAVSDRWYYPGQRVVVCLPPIGSRGNRQVSATVRRCNSDCERGYRIGLEFDHTSVETFSPVDPNALVAAA